LAQQFWLEWALRIRNQKQIKGKGFACMSAIRLCDKTLADLYAGIDLAYRDQYQRVAES
jgi:hypothetical protein